MDVGQWFIELVRAETRLYNAVDGRLQAVHGLSAGQYEILLVIARTENCRVLDIVREIGITVGAVSKAVDRIEAAGWCRRQANPHDRRSSYLVLTDAGQSLLAAATPTFDEEIAGRLAGVVGEEERARSGQTLAALRKSLEKQQREA